MAVVEVEGAQVSYRVDGNGPGMVLVHGTGADGDTNWGHLVPAFSSHWTVVRPDYSGSGQTRDSHATLDLPILARQVVAAAQAAGAVPFDLVGFSLGASIAAYIAAEYPQLVRSVVLLAGLTHGQDSRLKVEFELWRKLIDSDREALARVILLTGFSPDFLASWPWQQVQDTMQMILQGNDWEGMARQVEVDLAVDVREQIGRIRQPALVIGCKYDHMVSPGHSRALAQAIPGAQYAELPSGHLAPLECPEQFVALVKDFLLSGQFVSRADAFQPPGKAD